MCNEKQFRIETTNVSYNKFNKFDKFLTISDKLLKSSKKGDENSNYCIKSFLEGIDRRLNRRYHLYHFIRYNLSNNLYRSMFAYFLGCMGWERGKIVLFFHRKLLHSKAVFVASRKPSIHGISKTVRSLKTMSLSVINLALYL